MSKPFLTAALGAALLAPTLVGAALVTVTVEAPGVQTAQTGTSGATGVLTEGFDTFSPGDFGNVGSTLTSALGSYGGARRTPASEVLKSRLRTPSAVQAVQATTCPSMNSRTRRCS